MESLAAPGRSDNISRLAVIGYFDILYTGNNIEGTVIDLLAADELAGIIVSIEDGPSVVICSFHIVKGIEVVDIVVACSNARTLHEFGELLVSLEKESG